MTLLAYPLEQNIIRRESLNHTFGMVRNGGSRAHQGWDLLAYPGTPCFAISDGTIRFANPFGDYGLMLLLEFAFRGQIYYAAYCHLSSILTHRERKVSCGELIGRTGNTGNAASMRGEDQHLHLEIRTTQFPPRGLSGRIDPALLYGAAPLNHSVFEAHGVKFAVLGARPGLKVPGLNVRD